MRNAEVIEAYLGDEMNAPDENLAEETTASCGIAQPRWRTRPCAA
ncbi:hypothetical protein [Hydrogenophaga sp.]